MIEWLHSPPFRNDGAELWVVTKPPVELSQVKLEVIAIANLINYSHHKVLA